MTKNTIDFSKVKKISKKSGSSPTKKQPRKRGRKKKEPKICQNPECNNALPKQNKRFCSRKCGAKLRDLKKIQQNLPTEGYVDEYDPKYGFGGEYFNEYLKFIKEINKKTDATQLGKSSFSIKNHVDIPSVYSYIYFLHEKYDILYISDTLFNWAEKYDAMQKAIKVMEDLAHFILIKKGSMKEMSEKLAQQILNSKFGYREEKKVEHQGIGIVKHIYETSDKYVDVKAESRESLIKEAGFYNAVED